MRRAVLLALVLAACGSDNEAPADPCAIIEVHSSALPDGSAVDLYYDGDRLLAACQRWGDLVRCVNGEGRDVSRFGKPGCMFAAEHR
jgi:hypothetical protein